MTDIVVFGATGFTGTLVCERLQARGVPFTIAGRNRARLEPLSERLGGAPLRVADAEKPRTLNELTRGAKVLINCSGPFSRLGEPVVNAAVESGVHYLDTTGEQPWMKRILNRYDGVALRNHVTVINALAFEFAIGDWLAAVAARRLGREQVIDSISLGYTISASGISQGTALSMFEIAGELGWSYEGGRWRRRPLGWTRREMVFPKGPRQVTWLPYGETLLVPRHERVLTVLTYMALPKTLAQVGRLVSRAGGLLHPLLRPLADRYIARQPSGPTEAQRADGRFAIVAEARRAGEAARVTGTGSDPYGLSAQIVVLGAELLLSESMQRGVRSPAHLPIEPEAALAQVGITVV